ncbi:hypothetical protein [Dactylosporangium sp. NPDC051541]|uniref:hypothetical protein n=1 Tax=Dactylosporangium sp. NPDC051541 TaxID=3363977 RepID=UPI0037BB6AE3
MSIPTEDWVAAIGLGGVVAGSIVQSLSSSAGMKRQRAMVFENAVAEKRAELYISVLGYVSNMESRQNRHVSVYKSLDFLPNNHQEHAAEPSVAQIGSDGDLEARLATFSSMLVEVLFIHWYYQYSLNVNAHLNMVLCETLLEIPGIEHPSSEEFKLSKRLDSDSAILSAGSASLLKQQIRAELNGKESWMTGRRRSLSLFFSDKKQQQWNSDTEEFIEEQLPIIQERMRKLGSQLDDPTVDGQLPLW